MNSQSILLTIAIPTFNRSSYLGLTLEQLLKESKGLGHNDLEIVVSDNFSSDDTEVVAKSFAKNFADTDFNFRYSRNLENKGSDFNIAHSFHLANGKYVLILGDDDIIVDGCLSLIINLLKSGEWGVLCLKPFGYDRDFRLEIPSNSGVVVVAEDFNDLLPQIGQYITLISSMIINKSALGNLNPYQFMGENLVQVHLALTAGFKVRRSAFFRRYAIAVKRNNSGGYNLFIVFVTNLSRILDQYKSQGLKLESINAFENKLIISYFPFYCLKQMLVRTFNAAEIKSICDPRYNSKSAYKLWLKPILVMYEPLAFLWCLFVVVFGRVVYGDFKRGFTFLKEICKSKLFSS